jgi:Enoyl-CoA hydratase/isomerase
MATIYKRGGKWRAQIRRKGEPIQSRDFPNKTDAKRWASNLEGRIDAKDRGTREPAVTTTEPEPIKVSMTLGEALKRYQREITPTKRGAKQERNRIKAWLRDGPHHVAMEILCTGRWMDAQEARRWGLVNELVSTDRLLVRARELADLLASGPPLVFAAIKEVIRETAHLAIQDAFDLVKSRQVAAVRTLYQSEDAKEGARAFAEKRDPVWRGR